MTRRFRLPPLLLALGLSANACADAAPPPPPLGAGAGSEIEPASSGTPIASTTSPAPASSSAAPEPGGPAASPPPPVTSQPAAPSPSPAAAPASATFQAEDQELDGEYVESVSTPFSGVALYANGDSFSFEYEFAVAPGSYRADLTGASSNSLSATGELRLDTRSVGRFAFQGTTSSVESIDFNVQTDGTRTLTVTATNDDDTWDLFIDQIEISYVADEPSPSAASSAGAGF